MQIKSSDKIAIIEGGRRISYNQLVEKIYYWIKAAKIVKGSNVALVADQSSEWMSVLLATLKRKAKINLIDPNVKATKLALFINNSLANTLIISEEYLEKVEKHLKGNSILKNILLINKKIFLNTLLPETATYKPEGFVPAVRISTPGNFGDETSVLLSKSNLISNINNIGKRNLINENDRVLIHLSYCHAFGLIYALSTLMLNATLILSSNEDKEIFENPTLIASNPSFFNKLNTKMLGELNFLQNIILRLLKIVKVSILYKLIFKKVYDIINKDIRYMISFGNHLDKKVETNFKALGFNLISGYGLTEASPLVSASLDSPIGSVGKPFDDTMVKILNEEILIKGPSVMIKYANPSKENNSTINNGWLHTGDLGYIKENYLYIKGRKGDFLTFPSGIIHSSNIEDKIMKLSNLIKECSLFQKDQYLQIAIIPNLKNFKDKSPNSIEENLWKEVINKYNEKAYNKITKILLFRNFPKNKLNSIKKCLLKEEKSINFNK